MKTPLLKQVAALFGSFLLAVILASWPLAPAKAIFLRSDIGTPSTLITTTVFQNNSTSAIAANTITPIGSLVLPSCTKQSSHCLANACSGAGPIYKIHADGTIIPFSESVNPICWKDGSLKLSAIMWLDPESRPAGVNYTISSTGNSYNNNLSGTGAGQIVLTLTSTPTLTVGQPVVLSSLTGTGQYAQFDQQWFVTNVSGSVVTLQGSLQLGASTFTGGTLFSPGRIAVDVYSGGTTPVASNRSLADFCQGTYPSCSVDLNFKAVGLDNVSGTWEADLNQAINDHGADYKYMDGAAGAVWRVRACFMQSGACHGQLEYWDYVASLQDQSGNLYGLRWLGRVTPPYYNYSGSTINYYSFSSIGDYNGGTLLRDPWTTQETTFSFSWAGSGKNLTTTGLNWECGNLVRVSGGSLPTGLSAGTSYFNCSSISEPPYNSTTFTVGTNSAAITGDGSNITPTGSACSPCGTINTYPYVTPWGSFYDAQSDTQWNYCQCGGSSFSDPDTQIVPNAAILRSTGLTTAYNLNAVTVPEIAISGVSGPLQIGQQGTTFFPMTAGVLNRYLEQTSEICQIGPMTCYFADYMFNQSLVEDKVLHVIGYAGAQFPWNMRDVTNKQVLCANNACPSGMKSVSYTGFRWTCGAPVNGFTNPATTTVLIAGFDECATSHMPDFTMGLFLIAPEPEIMDQMEETGAFAILNKVGTVYTASVGATTSINGGNGSTRNASIAGTNYDGLLVNENGGPRADAWLIRMETGAVLASQADPSCTSCYSYFDAVAQTNENAINAYLGMFTSASITWPITNGVWNEGDSVLAPWEISYIFNAWNLLPSWTEDGANVLSFLNHMAKFYAYINNTFGTPYNTSYVDILRVSPNSVDSAYVSSNSGVSFNSTSTSITWSSISNSFTIASLPTGTTLANGTDYVVFDPNGGYANPGGAFSQDVPYYICTLTGSTFVVSTTSDCLNIVTGFPSTSGTGSFWWWSASLKSNTTNCITACGAASGYLENHTCALQTAVANGATVDSTTLTDMETMIQAQPNYPSFLQIGPKYVCQTSF